MDYFAIFDVSASGMEAQKTRIDTVALNLANVNTTKTSSGGPYRPLKVVIGERMSSSFKDILSLSKSMMSTGAHVIDIQESESEPRLVFEPEHPDANSAGFVSYPNINSASEMITLMESTRAYEANIKAINAAKTMALKALDIGRR